MVLASRDSDMELAAFLVNGSVAASFAGKLIARRASFVSFISIPALVCTGHRKATGRRSVSDSIYGINLPSGDAASGQSSSMAR